MLDQACFLIMMRFSFFLAFIWARWLWLSQHSAPRLSYLPCSLGRRSTHAAEGCRSNRMPARRPLADSRPQQLPTQRSTFRRARIRWLTLKSFLQRDPRARPCSLFLAHGAAVRESFPLWFGCYDYRARGLGGPISLDDVTEIEGTFPNFEGMNATMPAYLFNGARPARPSPRLIRRGAGLLRLPLDPRGELVFRPGRINPAELRSASKKV